MTAATHPGTSAMVYARSDVGRQLGTSPSPGVPPLTMRVLLTNFQLDHRTGTEIVVRDLALGLRRRRHEVAVYTPHPGAIGDELIGAGVPVVNRIECVPFAPDVVHGHHHSPTVEALTRFFDVPAIWVCHDRFGYQDIAPLHAGINRYI